MKRILCVLVFTVVSAGAPLAQPREAFEQLPPQVRNAAADWLVTDCTTGVDPFPRLLLRTDADVGAAFWEAFRLGPPQADVARLRREVERAYGDEIELLQAEGAKRFDPDVVDSLSRESRETWIQREIDAFDRAWRESALLALGYVGDAKVSRNLQDLADDPKSEFQQTAETALELRKRLRPGDRPSD